MRFFCISAGTDLAVERLRNACEKLGVEFVMLEPLTYDFLQPNPTASGDLLYRVDTTVAAHALEKFLLHPKLRTFYPTYHRGMSASTHNTSLFMQLGIAQPKTYPLLHQSHRLLKTYVDDLGGFPIIIKALGGSHGVGVIRVDSFPSLFSITDYLSQQNVTAVLRQYIHAKGHARLIVMGDRVIGSIEYINPDGDFRSNIGTTPNVAAKDFPEHIKKLAIDSIRANQLEFGGVDIMIDDTTGNGYVLEVNFPCFFPRVEDAAHIDIATQMVQYLIGKQGS